METQVQFLNYTLLGNEELEQILNWRNDESVKKWMRNKETISWEEHLRFVDSLKKSTTAFHFLVTRKNQNCAVVNFTFDKIETKKAEWGTYLAPEFIGSGIGLEIIFYSMHFFFSNYDGDELFAKMKKDNSPTIRLLEVLGLENVGQIFESEIEYVKMVMKRKNYQSVPKDFITFKRSLIKK